VALSAAGTSLSAQPAPMTTLIVRLCDNAGADRVEIAAAKRIVSDVYRDAAIVIDWARCEESEGVAMSLVPSRDLGTRFTPDAVGFAQPGSVDAAAIYDRVRSLAHKYRVNAGVLLGYVMAHELAHLLLPPNSHSDRGVMRASIDLQGVRDKALAFAFKEVMQMHAYLAHASGLQAPVYTAAALPQNSREAMRAPSAIEASLPQTTSGSTAAWPTQVP
jgi:hypothetical protein